MIHGVLSRGVLFAALCACGVRAARYSVLSVEPSRVVLGFSLDQRETSRLARGASFLFGVSALPAASPSPSAAASGDAGFGLSVRFLEGGWSGARYIQYFSLGAARASAGPAALGPLAGRITISYDRPVFRASSPGARFDNGVAFLDVGYALSKAAAAAKPALVCSVGVRMDVESDGIYRITGGQLRSLGVPTSAIPPRLYRLHNATTETPIYVTNPFHPYLYDDDEILFYGKALRGETTYYTQYSNANVYWLTWITGAAGLRVAEVSGAKRREQKLFIDITEAHQQIAAREFGDTLHFEQDNDIRWLGDLYQAAAVDDSLARLDIDNWYWEVLGDRELTQFDVSVPSPSTSTSQTYLARLRIAFMGLTSEESVPTDHNYRILINGLSPGGTVQRAVWDGQTPYVFVSDPFPVAGNLRHGKNIISLSREPSQHRDMVALNWMEIEYVRGFNALDDRITFRNHPDNLNNLVQFELTGFTQPSLDLWDIEKHRVFDGFEVQAVKTKAGTSYMLVFQDSVTSNTRYFAQARSKRMSPTGMSLDTIHDNWEFASGVDYIMITTRGLASTLEPLKTLHEKRGLKVAIVCIEDIYNRFSYGVLNPESIRTMLRYVFASHSSSPPRYLLLAGDASHDLYKNDARKGLTVVPTNLCRVPGWGPAADDGYFATFWGEDSFADIIVGRLPARGKDDLAIMVDKTVRYIQNLERGYWKDNMILAGGRESAFTLLNNEITSDIVGPKMHLLRMDADPSSPYIHTAASAAGVMAGLINAGAYLVNFAGHGGGNVWSDNSFFSFGDLSRLHNSQWGTSGRLPIVFSITCLTGFFESVFYPSLGEEFVRSGPDGAVAFYGASAYSKKSIDLDLDRLLLDNAVNGSYSTLGELLYSSELMLLILHGENVLPTIQQYNLLGDPALPYALVADTLKITLADDALKGRDTLKVSGSTAPVASGTVKIRVGAGTKPWDESISALSGGAFTYTLALPQSISTAQGIVRAFAWNDSAEVRGWATFSKDTVLVYDVRISPETPALGDSVTVMCKAALEDTASGVRLQCLHAVARKNEPIMNWEQYGTGTDMDYDSSSGYWITRQKLPTAISGEFNPNWVLMVKFRVLSSAIGETPVYIYDLQGRPDLLFTNDTLRLAWQNDSLRLAFQVLNKGSLVSPSYTVTFFWGDASANDTMRHIVAPALAPGAIADFSFALPDTQGHVTFSALINGGGDFEEIVTYNNDAQGEFELAYADLALPSDTLHSRGSAVMLCPLDTLPARSRVFLFQEPIAQSRPLSTESMWLVLAGEPSLASRIVSRPALGASDTLAWLYTVSPSDIPSGLLKAAQISADSSFASVFSFDSSAERWCAQGGQWVHYPDTFELVTLSKGPHALGAFVDQSPPVIQVFVAGREILFLDYAARGKPFSVFITDSSGVLKNSVRLLLNGQELGDEFHSEVRSEEDGATATLTAYPPPQKDVDSLTVIAKDLAGNEARKVFAYMPGEELSIRFFSCHPNPFSAKRIAENSYRIVRFAYLLTDLAKEVKISIYTIAGRKIWTWDGVDLIGYQEVPWNGLTHDGYRIANGTYYAKLVAKNEVKTVKKIIRIAKLEGY